MDLDIWKKAKKEKKLTIAQIAEKANLPKGTVQNIFCGYIPNPRVDTVEAIEKALGLDEKPYDWYMLTPQENELITDYKSAALPVELHQHVVGASGRNRTTDTGIFSPLLYRLSYRGI